MPRLLGRPTHKKPLGPINNPNWAAFVMLVTLLSVFNSVLITLIHLPDGARHTLTWINLAISFILWGDFFYMLKSAPDNKKFIKDDYGWLAFLGSTPFMRVLRIIWFWLVLRKYKKRPRDLLAEISIDRDAQGTLLLVLFIVLVVFQFAVVFILYYEAPFPDSNIKSVSDAFWWAFTTVSTVGYGDKYPVTEGGRLVGLSLMVVGIALFSVVTGTLAQWFVRSNANRRDNARKKVDKSAQDLDEIKQLLQANTSLYQESMDQLNARITELETRLDEIAKGQPK